jgi:NAD(P)H-flavin reductase
MSSSLTCEVVNNTSINEEFFVLQIIWNGAGAKAGQFFMIKPLRASTFLPRPFGVFEYNADQRVVKFLISRHGKGTIELSKLVIGEKVQLTGPQGNSWAEFLPENGKAGLVGGSAGVAPLAALVSEMPDYNFHFYAGFRQGFREKSEEDTVLGAAVRAKKLIVSAEDGKNALIGRITDFIVDMESFDVIFTCGPLPMMRSVKQKCESKNVKCFISMENRFACGVGVCLGCTINTLNGNKRCCKDGPIFPASDIVFVYG